MLDPFTDNAAILEDANLEEGNRLEIFIQVLQNISNSVDSIPVSGKFSAFETFNGNVLYRESALLLASFVVVKKLKDF
jgi:hypothetical protein